LSRYLAVLETRQQGNFVAARSQMSSDCDEWQYVTGATDGRKQIPHAARGYAAVGTAMLDDD
jgi:hypothetical protein